MKKIIQISITIVSSILVAAGCKSIEEPEYKSVLKEKPFEIRDYEPYIIAEVVMTNTMEEAGNSAFRPLFNYISGQNTAKQKIEMTAPVTQEAVSEKIPMTAPVTQEKTEKGWAVSFVMPADMTMDKAPVPNNDKITMREVPGRRVAAVKYSGSWSKKKYESNLQKLEEWIKKKNLATEGEPVWARYNPPFTPAPLRRNEILIPIKKTQNGD